MTRDAGRDSRSVEELQTVTHRNLSWEVTSELMALSNVVERVSESLDQDRQVPRYSLTKIQILLQDHN